MERTNILAILALLVSILLIFNVISSLLGKGIVGRIPTLIIVFALLAVIATLTVATVKLI